MHRIVLFPTDAESSSVAVPLLEGTYTLGRWASCDIVIADKSVSRQHARLALNGMMLTVTDLGSKNGTFVEAERIHASRVHVGQEVRFGAAPFRIALESGESLASICEDGETEKQSHLDASGDVVRLTASQQKVYDLLLAGVSEADIAARLSRSVNTVHTHVSAIYCLCGVHSRAELLARELRAKK